MKNRFDFSLASFSISRLTAFDLSQIFHLAGVGVIAM